MVTCGLCFAEFEDIGAGARPIGMGSAFVALADDAHSVYYNPAGIAGIGRKTFTAGYNKLYWGLSDGSDLGSGFAGYVQPLGDKGSLGAGVLSLGLSQPATEGGSYSGSLYSETTIIISYARNVGEILPAVLTREDLSGMYVGLSIKFLSKVYGSDYIDNSGEFTGTNSIFGSGGYGKSGLAADIGMLYRYNYNFSAGLVLTDLIAPDMGIETGNPMSMGLKVGGLYKAPYFNVVLDLVVKNGNFDARVGMEKWFMDGRYALRAGLSGYVSVGASYRFRENMVVEYSYNNPITGINNTAGSHVVSLNMSFGEMTGRMKSVEDEEEKQIDAAKLLRQTMIDEEKARAGMSLKYYKEALKLTDKGDFIEAQQKINSALTLNTENADIQALFKKLNTVAMILPVSTGDDRMSGLIRKGVRFYIDDESKQLVNVFQYLVEKYPKDRRIHDFMRIVKRQFPSVVRQEKISAGMNFIDQKLFRALNYLYNGKYNLAVNECKAVLDVEPGNVTALTRMGSACYVLGQEAKALRLWTEALKINPDNDELRGFIEEKGINLEQIRKKEAVNEKKEKDFRNSMNYYYKKEKTLGKEARQKLLQRIINKYKQSGVDISVAESELKKVKKEKTGKKEKKPKKKALTEAEKTALKKKYYGAGIAYKQKGQYGKAIAEFKKLLEIDPGHPQSKRQVKDCREKL